LGETAGGRQSAPFHVGHPIKLSSKQRACPRLGATLGKKTMSRVLRTEKNSDLLLESIFCKLALSREVSGSCEGGSRQKRTPRAQLLSYFMQRLQTKRGAKKREVQEEAVLVLRRLPSGGKDAWEPREVSHRRLDEGKLGNLDRLEGGFLISQRGKRGHSELAGGRFSRSI